MCRTTTQKVGKGEKGTFGGMRGIEAGAKAKKTGSTGYQRHTFTAVLVKRSPIGGSEKRRREKRKTEGEGHKKAGHRGFNTSTT